MISISTTQFTAVRRGLPTEELAGLRQYQIHSRTTVSKVIKKSFIKNVVEQNISEGNQRRP
jgi:hypothetical protein